jgi:hypothetical protein
MKEHHVSRDGRRGPSEKKSGSGRNNWGNYQDDVYEANEVIDAFA